MKALVLEQTEVHLVKALEQRGVSVAALVRKSSTATRLQLAMCS